MQKLKEGQVLHYPIELYLSNKHIGMIIALGLLLFPLYSYAIPWAQGKDDWILLACIWFFIIIILFALAGLLLALISGKPIFQVSDKGISISQVLRRPQQRYLSWQEVEFVGMDHRIIGRNDVWILVIVPSSGKVLQFPIKSMRYKGYLLNEAEIVYLVHRAFEGFPVLHYKPIEMQRTKWMTSRIKWLSLILIILCVVFYLFFMIN